MSQSVNIYCDESCHLENDQQDAMVLGAVWCPTERTRETAERIREVKQRHGLASRFEVKWTKVSHAKIGFYLDLLDYFFDSGELHFRALVIPDKTKLRHQDFDQSHDTWYYKMYFDLLKVLLVPTERYRIYLDVKDTRSASKVQKLHNALCNNMYDFRHEIIDRVQTVRSHEVEQLQLADLLIGIVSAANRTNVTATAKHQLIERMRERSGYSLRRSTLLREEKVNIFRWEAKDRQS